MLRISSKAPNFYELSAFSLSLDRYWDLYSAFLSSLLLRDYDYIVTLKDLEEIFKYENWVVIGPLIKKRNIERINENLNKVGVAVADSAFGKAVSYGIKKIDILVTDMDGLNPIHMNINHIRKLTSIVSVHFHGDNVDKAWAFLEILKMHHIRILPTCQIGGGYKVEKVNGFTDGDRAVLLSLIAGAKRVLLMGMDFSGYPHPNTINSPADYKSYFKLKIAKYVINFYSRVYEAEIHTEGEVYADR